MALKIALSVLHVDLGDEQTCELIGENLSHIAWTSVDQRVVATILVPPEADASEHAWLDAAMRLARQIHCALPRARVERVAEEYVSIPGIAKRLKVNRETVRSWVTGARGSGDFPAPLATLGGGAKGPIKLWTWARVNRWLDETYELGDGDEYLSDLQIAELNSFLLGLDETATKWLHTPLETRSKSDAVSPGMVMQAYVSRAANAKRTNFAVAA